MERKDLENQGLVTPNKPISTKDVERMTVNQLRNACKALKLPVYGCKRTLCQRLISNTSGAENSSHFSQNPFSLFNNGGQSIGHDNSTNSSITEYKLVELRAKCKELGLPPSGRKQELVDRLEAHYEKAMLSDILNNGGGNELNLSQWQGVNDSDNSFFITEDEQREGSQDNNFWSSCLDPRANFGSTKKEQHIDISVLKTYKDLDNLRMAGLRAVCKKLSIKVSGRKEEVIQRIMMQLNIRHDSQSSTNHKALFNSKRQKVTQQVPFRELSLYGIHATDDTLKSRLRSNSNSHALPVTIRGSLSTESINDKVEAPLSLKFFIFSFKFASNYLEVTLECETDTRSEQVLICETLNCTCQEFHGSQSNCKHILYVYLRIMKVETNNDILLKTKITQVELEYVLRQLKKNINQYRNNNPKPAFKKTIIKRLNNHENSSSQEMAQVEVIRENWADKCCGICFEFFSSNSSILWCREHCGKNVHYTCYEKWSQFIGVEKKCPYCQIQWKTIPKNTRFQSKLTSNRIE